MFRFAHSHRTYRQRTGMVYLAVLGVALIVGVIGIAALHVARLEIHELEALDDMARARLAARSGVECLLANIKSDTLWRTTYVSGVTAVVSDLANTLLGGDSFRYTLIDTDGDLDDNAEDSVTIRCVGQSGNARHVIEVLMQPTGEGLTCLSASIHANGDITVQDVVTTGQAVSSNGNIDATTGGANIQGNAQAVGFVTGNVTGSRTNGMTPPLEMPDPDSVFEYYVSNGTPIAYGELSGGKIDKLVLSAGYNPFGSQIANAQGIYVIDCQGNKVSVKDSRILGTLVFINATSGIDIEGNIHWEPSIPNFPAMMVQGSVVMKWKGNETLDENSQSMNYNPASTPYEGQSDAFPDDAYPGLISGLIYMTGDLDVQDQATTSGVIVIGGELRTINSVTHTYDSMFFYNSPPGFAAGTEMELVPGTWKQVSY